jgi:tetratricopeptide (TPR) repeat protein
MYDRSRLAEVYKLMDDGLKLAGAGKHKEAIDAFDKVLARAPLSDRKKEMVPAYLARAKEIEKEQRDEALAMLRKALRLDPKGPQAKKLEAEVAYLEGMVLIDRGTPDKFILQRAVELDPGHDGARAALASLEDRAAQRQSSLRRYGAAAGIGIFAIAAILLLSRRRKGDPAPPAPPEPAQQPRA